MYAQHLSVRCILYGGQLPEHKSTMLQCTKDSPKRWSILSGQSVVYRLQPVSMIYYLLLHFLLTVPIIISYVGAKM